jgi:hypothetical protein
MKIIHYANGSLFYLVHLSHAWHVLFPHPGNHPFVIGQALTYRPACDIVTLDYKDKSSFFRLCTVPLSRKGGENVPKTAAFKSYHRNHQPFAHKLPKPNEHKYTANHIAPIPSIPNYRLAAGWNGMDAI